LPRRTPRGLPEHDRRASIGDSGIDPVRAKLSDVTGIVPVAILVMIERPEREIRSRVPDRRRKREEEDDRENASHDPVHGRIIARRR
jgi:hypothetical protein